MPLSTPLTRRSFAHLSAGLLLPLIPASVLSHVRAGGNEQMNVVASFSILADWVRNVGGDAIDVHPIVPAGGDTHTFDPDPTTVAGIADARVLFAIGAGFEGWLPDIIEASGTHATVIEITRGMTLLTADDEHIDNDEEHDHDAGDPHIWSDVANAITAVESIRDALGEANPDSADTFQANADTYTGQLEELDASIRDHVATIPEENRKLVTSHDTFGYYAKAYGFEIIGTALGSFSTESGDPSARDIASLVEQIDTAGVPSVFAENVVNPALMQSIADEAGVELAPPLYSDALGEPGTDGDTYIRMMNWNTNTITAALNE